MQSRDKVIPIKYGGPNNNIEAYANLETESIEERSWDDGPSNEFFNGIKVIKPSDAYRTNYSQVFGHD